MISAAVQLLLRLNVSPFLTTAKVVSIDCGEKIVRFEFGLEYDHRSAFLAVIHAIRAIGINNAIESTVDRTADGRWVITSRIVGPIEGEFER